MELFISDKQLTWEEIGGGVSRKVMSYSGDLMVVKVRFRRGSIGADHKHPHTQISYVESGVFHYTIGGKTMTMEAGDTCLIPPDTVHGCRCIAEGVLIDAFTPARQDFIATQTPLSGSQ